MEIVIFAHKLYLGGGLRVGRGTASTLLRLPPEHQFLISCPAGVDYSDTECQENVEIIRPPKSSLRARFVWDRGSLTSKIDAFELNWIFGFENLVIQRFRGRQGNFFKVLITSILHTLSDKFLEAIAPVSLTDRTFFPSNILANDQGGHYA